MDDDGSKLFPVYYCSKERLMFLPFLFSHPLTNIHPKLLYMLFAIFLCLFFIQNEQVVLHYRNTIFFILSTVYYERYDCS